jgi:uncharacterized membrane protein
MQMARATSTPAITRRALGRPGKVLGLLFGLLFFIPVFGMAVAAGLGALMGKLTRTGIDRAFRHQVGDLVKPGTSAPS